MAPVQTMDGSVDPATLYTKQNEIGGGSFGKVYKGIDRRTGQAVAIKIIDVENAEDDVEDIIQEIAILAELSSPYVIRYYGSYLRGAHLWIVMEYCSGGSCADLLKPGSISEEHISIIVRELLMGLEYLHADQKLHRDIKAANVLVAANGQIKLADFGVSGQLTATMTKKNTFVGTPFWMAPEVIKQSGYDHKADIWSLGITALELANGEPPYSEIHPMKVLFLIPKNPPPQLTGNWSKAFKDFVELCVKRDPRERPSAKELLKHPFVRKAKKTVYLTELVERHEQWQASHGHKKSRDAHTDYTPDLDDRVEGSDNEDLWDFGTVRPSAAARPVGLRAMNDAATNSRSGAATSAADERGEETVKPRNASPQRRSVVEPAVPMSPAKVPLPPSPMKSSAKSNGTKQDSRTPSHNLRPFADLDRRGQPQQRNLATDLEHLKLSPQKAKTSPSSGKPLLEPIRLQEIPPFMPKASGSTSASSASAPNEASYIPQQKLPEFNASAILSTPSPSTLAPSNPRNISSKPILPPTTAHISHPSSSQPSNSPKADQTALSSVLLPALDSALARRTHHLKKLLKADGARGDADRAQRRQMVHDRISKCVVKAAGVFDEIQRLDEMEPAGMGGGIEVFLEGVLEELLVRLEGPEV